MSDSCGSERPGDGVPYDAPLASRHVVRVSASVPACGIASLFPGMWRRAGFIIFCFV